MYKIKRFRENIWVCNSYRISLFHVCWSVVTRGSVFSAALSTLVSYSRQKTTIADFRYKSLKSWKVDNIDLTQNFSLSIFTDFRYQSIKITWLLSIFIDWLLRVYTLFSCTYPSRPPPLVKVVLKVFRCAVLTAAQQDITGQHCSCSVTGRRQWTLRWYLLSESVHFSWRQTKSLKEF